MRLWVSLSLRDSDFPQSHVRERWINLTVFLNLFITHMMTFSLSSARHQRKNLLRSRLKTLAYVQINDSYLAEPRGSSAEFMSAVVLSHWGYNFDDIVTICWMKANEQGNRVVVLAMHVAHWNVLSTFFIISLLKNNFSLDHYVTAFSPQPLVQEAKSLRGCKEFSERLVFSPR